MYKRLMGISISLTLSLALCPQVFAVALLEQQVAFEGDEVSVRGIKLADFAKGLTVSFAPQDADTEPIDLTHRIYKRSTRKVLAVQLPLIPSESLTGSLIIKGSGTEVIARLPMVVYRTPAGVDTQGGSDIPEVPSTVDSGLVDSATILASALATFTSKTTAVAVGDSIQTALEKLDGTKLSRGAFNYENVTATNKDIGALSTEEVPVASINIVGITSTGVNTTIAKLTGGVAGQIVTLVFKVNNISVRDKVNSGAVDSINIAGTGVQIFNAGDVLRLLYIDTKWVEIARSLN
jgi:hypothetical protein